jgi:TolB-like protein/DNA-binding winged helix-turn-helix (wHTH) protein/Tfp pilus assembly protein PilF
MNNAESTMPTPPPEFEFGGFRLVAAERRLYRGDGSRVELSPRLFDALLHFVERPGQLLDKDSLLATLWPGLVVEDNNLNQLVSALRRALGDEAQGSRFIQTVPRRGFRFVGAVSAKHAQAAAAAPTVMAPSPATAPLPDGWRNWRMAWAWSLAALLAASALLLVGRSKTAPAPPVTTLAVLPFKPLTADGRDEVLEVGMADSLIARMSTTPGLVVSSIGSARRFGGAEQDPQRAARALEVQWIVDGTIQRWGDRVRVTARLLKAADGTATWSGSFDERFEDVFGVQDKISERVAQQLAPQLARSDRPQRAAATGSRDPAAYEHYLTARFHAQMLRADGLAKSIELYQRAIAVDPNYALAYAGLADTYRRMAIGIDAPPTQALAQGLAAAQRAVQIDPALAEAHAALGWMQWWAQWDWAGAEQSFRRATQLNANLAEAQMGLGHLLCSQQRCEEGLAHVQRARELDPLTLPYNVIEASYLRQRGRTQDSRARLDKVLQIEPRFWPAHQALAGWHVSARRPNEALAALRTAQSLAPGSVQPLANIGTLLASSGQPGPAREVLAQLLAQSQQRYVPPAMVASVYCALGEREAALDWLNRAREVRDVNLPFITLCSLVLKDEPRFDALRRELKLPAWRDGFCAPMQAPAVACPE